MKRMLSLLLALLLALSLAACGKQETPPTPDKPTPPIPEAGPITLGELNVELVTGERSVDDLMMLKSKLPPLLIAALAEQEVTVERVNVTFGASPDATAAALAKGDVQIGFVPLETYLANSGLQVVSTVEQSADALTFGFPVTEQTVMLRADFIISERWETFFASHTDMLDKVLIGVPVGDEMALRYLDWMLGAGESGITAADLPELYEYTDLDIALESADILVCRETLSEEQFTPVNRMAFGDVVAVSAGDEIIASEAFVTALRAALCAMSADEAAQAVLALYDGAEVTYRDCTDADFTVQREILGLDEALA